MQCRFARRWPELWAGLPDDRVRAAMSVALTKRKAAGGPEPTREGVEHVAELYRGEVTLGEMRARVIARPRGFRGGPAASERHPVQVGCSAAGMSATAYRGR